MNAGANKGENAAGNAGATRANAAMNAGANKGENAA